MTASLPYRIRFRREDNCTITAEFIYRRTGQVVGRINTERSDNLFGAYLTLGDMQDRREIAGLMPLPPRLMAEVDAAIENARRRVNIAEHFFPFRDGGHLWPESANAEEVGRGV